MDLHIYCIVFEYATTLKLDINCDKTKIMIFGTRNDERRKAMNLLYKRIRNLNLPIDLQIKLFDHTIAPILLYGCEIWGYPNHRKCTQVGFLQKRNQIRGAAHG